MKSFIILNKNISIKKENKFIYFLVIIFSMNITPTKAQTQNIETVSQTIHSEGLGRDLKLDIYVPKNSRSSSKLKTIYMNDGQDGGQLELPKLLENYPHHDFILVAIHTNENRLSDYGTSYIPDYKNRGDKATLYMQFVKNELTPFIRKNYPSSNRPEDNYFCGFSLGGLSAIDIVWENPGIFSKAGVFSGSFWWRSKAYEEGYDDDLDRIMHTKIRNSAHRDGLSFWFECGTDDEKDDRNKNGIIDSIDDTLDLISELKKIGYQSKHIKYVEVKGGQHNFDTWKKVFPEFLDWALQ